MCCWPTMWQRGCGIFITLLLAIKQWGERFKRQFKQYFKCKIIEQDEDMCGIQLLAIKQWGAWFLYNSMFMLLWCFSFSVFYDYLWRQLRHLYFQGRRRPQPFDRLLLVASSQVHHHLLPHHHHHHHHHHHYQHFWHYHESPNNLHILAMKIVLKVHGAAGALSSSATIHNSFAKGRNMNKNLSPTKLFIFRYSETDYVNFLKRGVLRSPNQSTSFINYCEQRNQSYWHVRNKCTHILKHQSIVLFWQ